MINMAQRDPGPPRRHQVERRLVAEWLASRYPDAYTEQNVRLGSMPLEFGNQDLDPMEAKLVHNAFARWADAIVYLDDRVIVVEGKIVAHPVALGQLQLYKRLLPFTPTIALAPRARIELRLVYGVPDELVVAMAREQGIEVEQFKPAWVDEYLNTRFHRQRGAPLAQRMADGTAA